MSATGKSTTIHQLASLGHCAVDLDTEEWSRLAPDDSEFADPGRLDWRSRTDKVRTLLTSEQGALFVAGTSTHQGRMYSLLDHVILLTVPTDIAIARLANRDTNDYGKDPDDLRRELHLRTIVEPKLRAGACLVIDTAAQSPEQVVTTILEHTAVPHDRRNAVADRRQVAQMMATFRVVVDSAVTDEAAVTLWPVYEAVFGDLPDMETWRTSVWKVHTGREGFRLARAYEGDRLVGFAYGYTGERGQWWTDQAYEALATEMAASWLGGHFELVSIGVLEQARGRGVGRALLHRVTEGLIHERWLLMTTADRADPARRLYDSEGWHVIGSGVANDQVIMAKGRPRVCS